MPVETQIIIESKPKSSPIEAAWAYCGSYDHAEALELVERFREASPTFKFRVIKITTTREVL